MPTNPPRVYWDADVLLSLINGYPERVPIIVAALTEAEKDNPPYELITSTLSIAEVAYAEEERTGRALSEEAEARIARLWHPRSSPIKLIEVYRLITEEAARLIRTLAVPNGWRLAPGGAIHLASAKLVEGTGFQTYDEKLDKFAEGLG